VFQLVVLLETQCHDALSTKRHIDDVGSAYNVDCFVGVLGDVICPRAIVLDQDMVYRMFENLLESLEWSTSSHYMAYLLYVITNTCDGR